MRNLSLGIFAVTSVSVAIGVAQAAYVGTPSSPAYPALAVHRPDAHPGKVMTDPDGSGYYIVRFKDAPVARYAGGVPGLEATDAHVRGERYLDVQTSGSVAYASYLDRRHGELLDAASRILGRTLAPRFEYRYAVNGMSVKLSPAEAARLAHMPDVVSVRPVRHFKPDSVGTPASAGATNASRAWINAPVVWQLATTASTGGSANEGEGIVVADLDTGINHSNTSFNDTGPLDNYVANDPGNLRFGVCDPSNTVQRSQKPAFFGCDNKLIGAYTYTHGTNDQYSPEDSEGHGSHTASTAVGDFVSVTVNGIATSLSGVAPHASIIAYDICDPVNLCSEDDSIAAVEQAIKDQTTIKNSWGSAYKGMVINYSIGGSDDAYGDPVEQAFLSAAEAGIYVSAAGGNGGPANAIANDPVNAPLYPVQHVGPWVATMAAATHDGTFSSNLLENFAGGESTTMPTAAMAGDGATAGFGPQPLVYAGDGNFDGNLASCGTEPSGVACVSGGSAAANAQQCLFPFRSGTFTANEIVVCDRGTNPLVDKAYNVEHGGAAGMVIATTSGSSQDMVVESYVIPATLLDLSDGDKLRAWLAASIGSATPASADLSGSSMTTDSSQADQVAGFSSRGPTDTEFDDLVKPDLTAPGVSVLAAVSNPEWTDGCTGCANQPETYDFYDGTSMATPHDTGAAALLIQAHHQWTAAEVKSALMLTAVTAANGSSPGLIDQCASLDSSLNCKAGTGVPSPQVRGAGRIDVDAAERTGVVMDETGANYEAADPSKGGDLTALNLASLGDTNCAGSCTWTRKLTSAFTATDVQYTISASDVSSGLHVSVSPSTFILPHGGSQTLTIRADTSNLAKDHWAFAQLDISAAGGAVGDGGAAIPPMHLTLAARAGVPSAHMQITPAELDFNGNGSQQLSIVNNGQNALHWSLASSGAVTSGNASSRVPAPLSSLWDQPDAGANTGYQSSFYTELNHGIYVADDFVLPAQADINKLVAAGFAEDSNGLLSVTGEVDWYIYADATGKPLGQPEDGKNDYRWHYKANASAAGVSTVNGTISLDLGVAGQPSIKLPAGTYWLIVAPHFNNSAGVPGNPSWFWFEGKSASGADSGMLIDPGQILDSPRIWQALHVSFEFDLSGTLDCSSGMPGLSASPTSGTVAAGQTGEVSVTFDTMGLANGSPKGVICVNGDASDNPQIVVPISAKVSGNAAGGGGGGGDFGLFGLATLLLAWRRRKSA